MFVVSAFESVDRHALATLDKGHTVADASSAVALLRRAWHRGSPVVAAVHPVDDDPAIWSTCSTSSWPRSRAQCRPGAVHGAPARCPRARLLLAQPALAPYLGAYDPARLGWDWVHPDPEMDQLQLAVAALVEQRVAQPGEVTFAEIDALSRAGAALRRVPAAAGCVSRGPVGSRARINEPWFCCSEPTAAQRAPLGSPIALDPAR